jgi:serine protease Do
VLITPEGELLTNWHVVDQAVEVRCLLYDGSHYTAEVVGSDQDTDLALVRLVRDEDDDQALPFATLGDSLGLREGDFVMAMGAPWGLSRSVSIGIISCTRRYLEDHSEYSLWLQTDAAISPGNSGGPLVNTAGEVVGINALGMIVGGDMGFAIPAETIEVIVAQLREHGQMNWSWTGLQLQALRDFNRNVYFDADEGVIVADTDPESPARRAGLQPRDRIVRIAGRGVTAMSEEDLPAVRRRSGLLPKAEPIEFVVYRGDERMTFEITPAAKGEVEGEELESERWDMTFKEINRFDNPDLYFHRHEGVFIFGVEYPGNAAQAGLQVNDIVLSIDGEDVTTLEDVQSIHDEAIDALPDKHRVLVSVLRNGLLRQIVLDYSRDYQKE